MAPIHAGSSVPQNHTSDFELLLGIGTELSGLILVLPQLHCHRPAAVLWRQLSFVDIPKATAAHQLSPMFCDAVQLLVVENVEAVI